MPPLPAPCYRNASGRDGWRASDPASVHKVFGPARLSPDPGSHPATIAPAASGFRPPDTRPETGVPSAPGILLEIVPGRFSPANRRISPSPAWLRLKHVLAMRAAFRPDVPGRVASLPRPPQPAGPRL